MSTIRADSVSPSAGGTSRNLPRGVAAAWLNLNGTGTIAVRDSQNISGVVDNGTGDHTASYTSAMSSANYAMGGTATLNASGASAPRILAPYDVATFLAGSCRMRTGDDTGSVGDCAQLSPMYFGSLA